MKTSGCQCPAWETPALGSGLVLELNKPGFDLEVTLGSLVPWSPVYTMEINLLFICC